VSPEEKSALIHMLIAQREQITASLLLLTKDEPAPATEKKRTPPPVLGRRNQEG
jgi:hypothetical protein